MRVEYVLIVPSNVEWSWWVHNCLSKNVVRTHDSLSHPYQVCTSSVKTIRFMPYWHYVNAVVPTCLLSPYCVLIRSGPRYVFLTCSKFTHISQDHKGPNRFLLRSFYRTSLYRVGPVLH